jgi:GT2 family glycosyltransferase
MTVPSGAGTISQVTPRSTDVAVVVVALRDSERLGACLDAILASRTDLDFRVYCVIADLDADESEPPREGVAFLYPRMNLGWAGSVHWARRSFDATTMWLIQDDILVEPGTLDTLHRTLLGQPALGATRPVVVDAAGTVPAGSCGAVVDARGNRASILPATDTPYSELQLATPPSYLPSSALMVRCDAWDQVGGFDPWFYPVNYVDVDFGFTLAHAGWGFTLVPQARIQHPSRGSTPWVLGQFSVERNEILFKAKWFPDELPALDDSNLLVADSIIEEATGGRCMPRDTDHQRLRAIAGAAAADGYVRLARWAQRTHDRASTDLAAVTEARDWWHDQADRVAALYQEAAQHGSRRPGD